MGDPLNGTVGAMPVKHSADIYIYIYNQDYYKWKNKNRLTEIKI